ncbi:MAG: MarR family transcriptional regulator [Devosia sp.]
MDEFADCMVTNARMAARAVTRRYDGYLRPFGLTATQLSLLGAIHANPGATVSALAEKRGFERTTLTRNLDRLESLGHVVSMHPERGNGRIARITKQGGALLEQLLPLWRKAQQDLRTDLSPEAFDGSITMLQRLANLKQQDLT